LHAFDKRNKQLSWFAAVGKDNSLELSKTKAEANLKEAVALYVDSLLQNVQNKSTKQSVEPRITANMAKYLILEELETFKSYDTSYGYLVVAGINPEDIEHLLNKFTRTEVSLASLAKQSSPFVKVRAPVKNEVIDATAFQLVNTTKFDRKINDVKYYNFVVHVEAKPSVLQDIDSVVYHMHSSFREQRRVIRDRDNGFKISWLGWRVFTIRADMHLHNGNIIKLNHPLQWTD